MIRSSKILKCESAKVIIALLFVVQASACFSQIAQLKWDTQLDRPVDHPLIIYRGETLDLLPRLVQGTDPVAITNQALYFRYREPSLITSNLYREVAITTNAAPGTLQFTWTPELDILSPTYDYEFVVGSNPRVHGRITMRGTISYPASTNAPAPSTRWLTDLDLAAATASLATTSDLAAVASDLQSTSNSLAASINDVQAYSETNRTDKLWSGGTSYMDGDGVMWEIISRPYNTLTCVQADAHPELLGGVWSEAIHPIWPAPGFFSRWPNERYPLIVFNGYTYTADWSEWYIQEQYQRDLLFIDIDGNSAHQNPFEMSEMNYAGGSIWMLKEPAGVTTNIITRLATKNYIDTALINYVPAGDFAKKLNITDGTATNLTINTSLWVDGKVNIYGNFSAVGSDFHVEGDAEFDDTVTVNKDLLVHGTATGKSPTLPAHFATKNYVDSLPKGPTNSVAGWLLYDTGSNIWLRVNVSNLSFTVHEVLP